MEQVEAVEEVEGRLSHSLATRFVEQDRGGDADVQRLDGAGERDRDELVAGSPHQGSQPASFGAEHERGAAIQIHLPHRLARLARGAEDPEVRALDLAQVARKVLDDRDRNVLDRPGR